MVEFTARGLMVAAFTCLNEDMTINFEIIPEYASYLKKEGFRSVLVGGTTAEHVSLAVADRKALVEAWVAAAKTLGLHVQAHVGGAPLADVLDMVAHCASSGVDSVLMLPELYFKPETVDQLVDYVSVVAGAAPSLPVLYYHTDMSHVKIHAPTFVAAASARIPNFMGIKFTPSDLTEAAQVLRVLRNDQEMFLACPSLIAPAALLGVKSHMSGVFNMFPTLAADIVKAVQNNNVEEARKLQEKLSLAIEALTCEGPWIPVIKAGMEIVTGIKVGPPSLLHRHISAEAKLRIRGKLVNLGLIN